MTLGVELTDAGRVPYEDARRIVDQVEQAKTRAQSAARGQTGHIRVGFASSVVFHPVIAEIVRIGKRTMTCGCLLQIATSPR